MSAIPDPSRVHDRPGERRDRHRSGLRTPWTWSRTWSSTSCRPCSIRGCECT